VTLVSLFLTMPVISVYDRYTTPAVLNTYLIYGAVAFRTGVGTDQNC